MLARQLTITQALTHSLTCARVSPNAIECHVHAAMVSSPLASRRRRAPAQRMARRVATPNA
eukprot:5688919-Pleurochrysis_carterae.AAC.2